MITEQQRTIRHQQIDGWNQNSLEQESLTIIAPPETSAMLVDALIRGCILIGIGKVTLIGLWTFETILLNNYSKDIQSVTQVQNLDSLKDLDEPGRVLIDLRIHGRKNSSAQFDLVLTGSFTDGILSCHADPGINPEAAPEIRPIEAGSSQPMQITLAGMLLAETVRHLVNNTSWNESDLIVPISFRPETAEPSQMYKNILLVGAGAIGTWFCYGLRILALDHVIHTLTIIDPDIYESSNLNRQVLITKSDVGSPKAVALSNKISKRMLDIETLSIVDRLDENFPFQELIPPDVIVSAVDSWRTRSFLNRLSLNYGIPLINGGTDIYSANVQKVLPGQQPGCLNCLLKVDKRAEHEREVQSCADATEPSIVTTNMIAAGLMLNELISDPGLTSLVYDIRFPNRIGYLDGRNQNHNCYCSGRRAI